MNQFEKLIGETFQKYRDARIANPFFLHPPMRIAGMHGHVPCFVQSGKAPYDIGGYLYDDHATALGVELKETRDHEHSLPIIGPDKKGSGLQYHQLSALVDLHQTGGYAGVLWSNGGEIGWLNGDVLVVAKMQYDTSMKAETARQGYALGSRSILWGLFKPIKYGHEGMPLWLPQGVLKYKKYT